MPGLFVGLKQFWTGLNCDRLVQTLNRCWEYILKARLMYTYVLEEKIAGILKNYHWISISSLFLQTLDQVYMKNIVKSWKVFFRFCFSQ